MNFSMRTPPKTRTKDGVRPVAKNDSIHALVCSGCEDACDEDEYLTCASCNDIYHKVCTGLRSNGNDFICQKCKTEISKKKPKAATTKSTKTVSAKQTSNSIPYQSPYAARPTHKQTTTNKPTVRSNIQPTNREHSSLSIPTDVVDVSASERDERTPSNETPPITASASDNTVQPECRMSLEPQTRTS